MFDCQKCGACCSNPLDPKWIEVTEEDAKHISDDLLQPGDMHKYAMKQNPNGRCVALEGEIGQSCGCTIYPNRPAICRAVQPHDNICNDLRQIHKISDSVALPQ